MHLLGGSASVAEQEDKVASVLNLNDRDIAEIHRGNTTKLSYRLAWARNYLKRYGLLENSARGVWSLTPEGIKTQSVDPKQVNRCVKQLSDTVEQRTVTPDEGETESQPRTWED